MNADPRYRCPACHDKGTLWEDVEVDAWRALDEYGKPVPRGLHGIDYEVMWDHPRPTGMVGCSCGWEGKRTDFETQHADGEWGEQRTIHPQQMSLNGLVAS